MSEHTPGPWAVSNQWGATQVGPPSGSVAVVTINQGVEQAQANARLIAAAPELLEMVAQLASGSPGDVQAAWELIRRIKGESR